MSTRSVVGIKSDSGYVGVYCHSDGYAEAQLPTLTEIIARDGAKKAGETLMSADAGGWSYLDTTYADNSLGGDRAAIVEGYGLKYLDAPGSKPITFADFRGDPGLEFAYFIDISDGPEQGTIYWAAGREDLQALPFAVAEHVANGGV